MHPTCVLLGYLSAIHFLHIAEGETDPFQPALHRLQYILQSIKWSESREAGGDETQAACIPKHSQKIKKCVGGEVISSGQNYSGPRMVWCCCFWLFEDGRNDSAKPRSVCPNSSSHKEDIAVDDPATPSIIKVTKTIIDRPTLS